MAYFHIFTESQVI